MQNMIRGIKRRRQQQRKETARNRRLTWLTFMLVAMPDALWERMGSDPEDAREYLRNEIRENEQI
jgi:hypothetical protein